MPFSISSFRKNRLYETSASAIQIRSHLTQVAEFDVLAKRKNNQYTVVAVFCGIFSFLTFLPAPEMPVFFFIALPLAIATIVAGILAARWRGLNIPDVRYQLSQRLIEMLSRDMAKDGALSARLDFSVPTINRKQTAQGPHPHRRGWKQVFYADPWLNFEGQFLDGTLFELKLTEYTVVRSGTKRSRSGKIKHKCKVKNKGHEVQLMLRFPRKKYGAMSLLKSDLPEAVSLPPEVVLKQIKVNDHQLLLRVKSPAGACRSPSSFYQLITQMFLSAYQALNLSKTLSKASA